MMRPTVVDLFCGAGGFSLGFEMAGFEVIYGLDSWEVACETFRQNFPRAEVMCADALQVDPGEIPDADVIIGGPPCQGFTIARVQAWHEDRRQFDFSLVDWFLKVVAEKKPRYWIMENVPAPKLMEHLRGAVPDARIEVYEMWRFGVPQVRRRLFAGRFETPEENPTQVVFPAVLASEIKGGIIERRRPGLGIRLGSVFRRRTLLPEAMLVQTFPLDFYLAGSLQDRYVMIGNAVPPLMAFKLAEAIRRALG